MRLMNQDRDADDVIEHIVPYEFERPDAPARPDLRAKIDDPVDIDAENFQRFAPMMRMIPHVQAKSSARAALS